MQTGVNPSLSPSHSSNGLNPPIPQSTLASPNTGNIPVQKRTWLTALRATFKIRKHRSVKSSSNGNGTTNPLGVATPTSGHTLNIFRGLNRSRKITTPVAPSPTVNIQEIIQDLQAVHDKAKQEKRPLERLTFIMKSFDKYASIVDVAVNYSPQPAALIWAGIRLTLQVCLVYGFYAFFFNMPIPGLGIRYLVTND